MSEGVVFDTNVLPAYRGLDGPLWMSLAKLCALRNVPMYLPHLVLDEALNMRRGIAEVAHARFVAAQSELNKVFPVDPVYVPDIEDIVVAWEEELRSVFQVIEVHGDDAAEALHREATRSRPAREGKGARDSAIWLSAVRLAANHEVLLFVSGNTKDFGVRKTQELHPNLAAEAAEAGLLYLTSLQALLDRLATRVDHPTLDKDELAEQTTPELVDALLRKGEAILSPPVEPEELRGAQAALKDHVPKQAYLVDGLTLVLVDGTTWTTTDQDRELRLQWTAWVEVDQDAKIQSVELVRVVVDADP